uniref:cysteine desulfurase n=1 Tax=Thermoanaerobaculum aquaticum TaxID=1312852 RepID=A0A7V1ZHB4_9BACT
MSRSVFRHRWFWVALALYAGTLLVLLLNHEPWRDEMQAWLLARDSASPLELWRNTRYEGHPLLWHLLLWLLSRWSQKPLTMQLAHAAIAVLTAGVFLAFAPFPRWLKVLWVFGYFPLFEYGVISRNYGLTVLFLFLALALRERGNHLVTSQIEHHAVLRACQFLERRLGFQVTYLPVDQYGRVDPRAVEEALTDRTVLVSVMLGNNEVGTLQPIQAIAEIAHARGVLVHTDAVQGVGLLPVRVDDLEVDLLSLSAHKFYGPKGVGALYVRKGVALAPQIHGGGQERNRRAGTENVPLVVGMAAALRLARSERESRVRHVLRLRDRLLQEVPRRVPGALVTGHPVDRLPHIASFVFPGVESEGVLMALDLEGICASSGSACTSGSLEPSHVLRAMGLPREATTGSLRLSVGKDTTDAHVDRLLQVLPGVVERARAVPVGESVSR